MELLAKETPETPQNREVLLHGRDAAEIMGPIELLEKPVSSGISVN